MVANLDMYEVERNSDFLKLRGMFRNRASRLNTLVLEPLCSMMRLVDPSEETNIIKNDKIH